MFVVCGTVSLVAASDAQHALLRTNLGLSRRARSRFHRPSAERAWAVRKHAALSSFGHDHGAAHLSDRGCVVAANVLSRLDRTVLRSEPQTPTPSANEAARPNPSLRARARAACTTFDDRHCLRIARASAATTGSRRRAALLGRVLRPAPLRRLNAAKSRRVGKGKRRSVMTALRLAARQPRDPNDGTAHAYRAPNAIALPRR